MQNHSTHSIQSEQESQTIESWREIPGNNRYEVSSFGRIRSWYWRKGGKHQDEPLYKKLFKSHLGYVICRLQWNGTSKNFLIHRLVMLAFVGESELSVNHKDGDKANNHLDNLEYMTHAENVRYSFESLDRKPLSGQDSGRAKLSDIQVEWVAPLSKRGQDGR